MGVKKDTSKIEKVEEKKETPVDWFDFVIDQNASEKDIKGRLTKEIGEIINSAKDVVENKIVLYVYDNNYDITSFTSDRVYTSLLEFNHSADKDVLLLISSG